jgi:SsrA-binding protein
MAAKKGPAKGGDGVRYIARNRKARFNFEIIESVEAGLVLQGTEVKSLRAGRCNLGDSYADFQGGEAWLRKVHISPYEQGNRMNHDPFRPRKLLLHNREIRRLQSRVEEKGLTLVPLSLYFKRGKVKCELALARGKRLHDKRASAADRAVEKKMRDAVRGGIRSHESGGS